MNEKLGPDQLRSTAAKITKVEGKPSEIPMPPGWDAPGTIHTPTGLNPIVEFEEPGDMFEGVFLGARPPKGTMKSPIYDFAERRTGEIVSVWGTTILDTKLAMVSPRKGDLMGIQYLGTVETSRGMNPAKEFRVVILQRGS